MAPLKTIKTTLVSAIFRQFGSCYLILQDKHNLHTLSLNIKLICTRQRLAFLPISKACTNKFYIFLQCTYIVYIESWQL